MKERNECFCIYTHSCVSFVPSSLYFRETRFIVRGVNETYKNNCCSKNNSDFRELRRLEDTRDRSIDQLLASFESLRSRSQSDRMDSLEIVSKFVWRPPASFEKQKKQNWRRRRRRREKKRKKHSRTLYIAWKKWHNYGCVFWSNYTGITITSELL